MVYESTDALNGVAGAILALFSLGSGVSSVLYMRKRSNPIFLLIMFFCVLRVVTAALQLNMPERSWEHNAGWVALVSAGHPVLTFTIAVCLAQGGPASNGKMSERSWEILISGIMNLVVFICRIIGGVAFARHIGHNDMVFKTPAVFLVGESFSHAAVANATIFGLICWMQISKRRREGCVVTSAATSCHVSWPNMLRDVLPRDEVLTRFHHPYYLTWFYGGLAQIPALIIRHVYSALATYMPRDKSTWPFMPAAPNVAALACLCYLPEVVIVFGLLFAGSRAPATRDEVDPAQLVRPSAGSAPRKPSTSSTA